MCRIRMAMGVSLGLLALNHPSSAQFLYDAQDKIEPALLEAMSARGPDEPMAIGMWLHQGYDPDLDRLEYQRAVSDTQAEQIVGGAPQRAVPYPKPVKVALEPPPPPPKIEKALSERLAVLADEDMLDVEIGVWFAIPNYKDVQALHLAGVRDDQTRAAVSAAVNERIAQGSQPIVAALGARGFAPTYVSTHAPILFAWLDKATIEELATRDDVQAICLTRTYQPGMENAAKTERADVVWARGIDGASWTKIGVVEVPFPEAPTLCRIDRPHTYLAGPNDATTAFRPGAPPSDHATRVAGRIAALKLAAPPDRWRGVAPGVAPLLSANASLGTTADVIAASDWALGQGAHILNFSLEYGTDFSGTPNELARYIDFIVNDHLVTVTTIAGNEGTTPNHVVTNPGLAYNSITVGAFEDWDDNKWTGDSMWADSCYRDPPEANTPVGIDRELPEVVAVGATVEMTNIGGMGAGDPRNGTSYAAPAVAGIAALLMERTPLLLAYPETVRAIIMAGACHNIEGDSRLSDKDGAGAVVACEADEIARGGRFHSQILNGADFEGGAPGGAWTFNGMSLTRALKARVVISWLVPAGGGPNYNYPAGGPLTADLDLEVYNPNGTLAAYSVSYDNNYEIVEFTPSQTGVHPIQVRAFTWTPGGTAPLGIAWTQEPCCSPDFGDAPDDMLDCPRPAHGDFPTREASDGARTREYEVEWLSIDHLTTPGATWEMDAYVDPYQLEKDQDGISNININPPPLCRADQDGEDDGLLLPAIYWANSRGRVTFFVDSATPNIGRYSTGDADHPDEEIYVSIWFDWERDDVTWAQAPNNYVVHWIGGPTMVGVMDRGTCIEGCDLWDPSLNQKRVTAEFDVPAFESSDPLWVRARLSYGEDVATQTGEATYGEVEDYVVEADHFSDSQAEIEINGGEIVTLTGPTTVMVNLSGLADTDGDGSEEVPTEMVEMELTGTFQSEPVIVRLRPETSAPFKRSLGQIKENENVHWGVLDIPPFTVDPNDLSAFSFFDMYFEIEIKVQGEPVLLHNVDEKHMQCTIHEKPPGEGETYESPDWILLYDEQGYPTEPKLWITAVHHTPRPRKPRACCHPGGTCTMTLLPNCDGIPGGPFSTCALQDCNNNGADDFCDIASGLSGDCDGNGVPDECQPWADCNANGVPDFCDIAECDGSPWCSDCNENGIPDECDIIHGASFDCQPDGVPDECEVAADDCNYNGIPDDCDVPPICQGPNCSQDCNFNLIPDECEPDCQPNGRPDDCDIAAGYSLDCQANGIPDECDLASGESQDCNGNLVPDGCDIANGTSQDCNGNGIPDECDIANGTSCDCQGDSIPDECNIANGTSQDCNGNGIPNECEIGSQWGGFCATPGIPCFPAECDSDWNHNGVPDSCEICGDLDIDGNVDMDDYWMFLDAFGTCIGNPHYRPDADLDGDGCVTLLDYQAWRMCYKMANGKEFVAPKPKPSPAPAPKPRRVVQ